MAENILEKIIEKKISKVNILKNVTDNLHFGTIVKD